MVSLSAETRKPPFASGSCYSERCRPVSFPRISQCRYDFKGLGADVLGQLPAPPRQALSEPIMASPF